MEASVGIGLPVRNGERSLQQVLESIQAQSFTDFSVTIVDNCSTDGTPRIAKNFVRDDPRFRYVRQEAPVTMWQNFERAFREVSGEYFMFAADDLYSPDWLAELRSGLAASPHAVLAFSEEVVVFDGYQNWIDGVTYEVALSTVGVPRWRRLIMDRHDGYAVCGLFRRAALVDYRWVDHSTSPDWPLMTYAMLRGEVIAVRGPKMFVPRNDRKGGAQRIADQSFGRRERYPALSLAEACASAAADAEGRPSARRTDFLLLLGSFIRGGVKRRVRLGLQSLQARTKRPARTLSERETVPRNGTASRMESDTEPCP